MSSASFSIKRCGVMASGEIGRTFPGPVISDGAREYHDSLAGLGMQAVVHGFRLVFLDLLDGLPRVCASFADLHPLPAEEAIGAPRTVLAHAVGLKELNILSAGLNPHFALRLGFGDFLNEIAHAFFGVVVGAGCFENFQLFRDQGFDLVDREDRLAFRVLSFGLRSFAWRRGFVLPIAPNWGRAGRGVAQS